MLIQVMLRAPFPGYQGWADFFSWLMCFLYGYILVSSPHFEKAIKHQGGIALATSIVCLAVLGALYAAGFVAEWEARPDYTIGYVFYQALRGLVTWSLLAFILNFALHFLSFTNRALDYMNEAVLPFYILHYPIVVITAFYLGSFEMSVVARFLLVSSISLAGTLIVYDLFIRRVRVLRWLFGMKPPLSVEAYKMAK